MESSLEEVVCLGNNMHFYEASAEGTKGNLMGQWLKRLVEQNTASLQVTLWIIGLTLEKGCCVLLIKQMPGALRLRWKRENERERKGFELHFIFYIVFSVSFNSVTNSSSCLMWGYVVFFQVQCFPDTSWLNFRYSENETVLLLFNTEYETATSTCSLLLLSTKQTQSYNSVNLTQHGGVTKHNIPNILPWTLLP